MYSSISSKHYLISFTLSNCVSVNCFVQSQEINILFVIENFYHLLCAIIFNKFLIAMKQSINYSMLRAISAILLGAILIWCHRSAIFYIVISIGILFIVPGLISIISYLTSNRAKRLDVLFLLVGIGSLFFGIVLVSAPYFFIGALMYLLGIILLLGSIEQFVTLIRAAKKTTVPAIFYVIPSLILIAGGLVLFNPFKTAETLFILIGATCLVYGIMEFVHWVKFSHK